MGNSPSALETCLREVCAGRAGCAAFPGAPLYQAAWVRPFNLEIPVEPAGVIRPMDSEEVAGAVRCAVEEGVKVQAKSGGHSYAYVRAFILFTAFGFPMPVPPPAHSCSFHHG